MKRSVFTVAIATLLVVAFSMSAEAQRGGRGGQGGPGGRGGPGGMMMGGGMMGRGGGSLLDLARVEEVQKEILADEGQVAKIDKLVEELRGERPDMSGFRDMSEEERTKFIEKMQKERAERAKVGDKKLAEILIEPQLDRLEEIRVQQLGIRALMDDKVVAKLGIGSKKAKIEAAMTKMGEEMMAIFRSGDRENMREKIEELRKKADTDVLGLLSADEKKKFEDMKGEAFEMPQRQRGGPGGGPRGGQGDGGTDRPRRPGV